MKFKTMVICSTLNQMVNYIAIKEHEIEKVINLTVSDKFNGSINHQYPYHKWDSNLEDVLKVDNIEIESIEFKENDIIDHKNIKEKLKETKKKFGEDEPILWNITGGQRHFVMAITDFVYEERKKDYLLYFEGDREKFYYYNKEKTLKYKEVETKEFEFNMTIEIALRLMGFDRKQRKLKDQSKYYKSLFLKNGDEDILNKYDYYNKLFELYSENESLVKAMIASNREKKNNFEKLMDYVNKLVESDILNEDLFKDKSLKILKKSLEKNINGKVFGYILEKMAFYRIIKIIKDNGKTNVIADIHMSVKLADSHSDSNTIIDEFDIMILTKKGKVFIFECKSGKMTGDNAKSTSYSVYRAAGVYGLPILISPLTVEDSSKKHFKIKKEVVKEDIYKNIRSAENSANRSNMVICRIKRNVNKANRWGLEDFIKENI